MISPTLFNIYCEDLCYTLEDQINVHMELGYADDMLVICSSLTQLRRVIEIIRAWTHQNNLMLNEKKSGIVEFLPRLDRQSAALKINSSFEGVPVVDRYKYLGMWVNFKLTLDPQLDYIREKSQYQVYKLWPLLRNVSLDYRISLWTILIRPMFEMLVGLFEREPHSNREKVFGLFRGTFKKFTLLCKNVKNSTVDLLMDFDFEKRASQVVELCRNKWRSRKLCKVPVYSPQSCSVRKHSVFWPKELQVLLNLKSALCPECHIPCGEFHMLSHNIFIPSDTSLFQR